MKEETVTIRLTQEEKELANRVAGELGLTLSAHYRMLIRQKAKEMGIEKK